MAMKLENELDLLDDISAAIYESISARQNETVRQKSVVGLARLSASLIHDLRNPLATISAGAELLMDMDLECPQSKRLVYNVYRASRRLDQLFQSLVDISRGSRETLKDCRLVDVIRSAFEHIADTAESRGICVEIIAPEWIQLPLQRQGMERVFLNMMNNALESMQAGGQLRISARVDRSELIVKIDDTGRGIPEYLRPNLFTPFVSSGKKNGVGLGLMLSRQTVIEHGGDLWLGDKCGPGALFYLRLPLKLRQGPEAPC